MYRLIDWSIELSIQRRHLDAFGVKNNEFIDQNNLKISKTKSESNINSLNTVEQTSIKEVNIKDEAIKEIKQLKELLDSGILTKNEYEKRASELKKIILGN